MEIKYPEEKYFGSFHRCLNEVAQEKIYLEMVEAPPEDKVKAFQRSLVEKNGPVYYAVQEDKVFGWCDIFPNEDPRQSHRGNLGMGILKEFRGMGIGAKLMDAVINHRNKCGLEKIELTVYHSNLAAIALYKKFGFEQEGLIKKYRKLDGLYVDAILMSKFISD